MFLTLGCSVLKKKKNNKCVETIFVVPCMIFRKHFQNEPNQMWHVNKKHFLIAIRSRHMGKWTSTTTTTTCSLFPKFPFTILWDISSTVKPLRCSVTVWPLGGDVVFPIYTQNTDTISTTDLDIHSCKSINVMWCL